MLIHTLLEQGGILGGFNYSVSYGLKKQPGYLTTAFSNYNGIRYCAPAANRDCRNG